LLDNKLMDYIIGSVSLESIRFNIWEMLTSVGGTG